MNKLMTIQSNLFILISCLALIFAYGLDLNANLAILLITLGFVIVLGVPHGSLDVLFASQTYRLIHMTDWFKFIVYYVVAALAVILVWLAVPTIFFIAFLILSAMHFSDDLNQDDFKILKLSYGTAIITCTSLFFSTELIDLYARIIQIEAATKIVKATQLISIPALLIIVAHLFNKKINVRTKLELLFTCAIFLLLNPLLAFGIYFCGMHSARHLIRSRIFLASFSRQTFLSALIFPTIAVIMAGLLIWWAGPQKPLEIEVIRIIFVGLAALTVPHAWVLKKSNFQT